MSNACFNSNNAPGQRCRDASRGTFEIPTGGPFVNIGEYRRVFKVTYFKYAASIAYRVVYDGLGHRPIWTCTCPDFEHNDRASNRTCCKHIQCCIDRELGIDRDGTGETYEQFKIEHINIITNY